MNACTTGQQSGGEVLNGGVATGSRWPVTRRSGRHLKGTGRHGCRFRITQRLQLLVDRRSVLTPIRLRHRNKERVVEPHDYGSQRHRQALDVSGRRPAAKSFATGNRSRPAKAAEVERLNQTFPRGRRPNQENTVRTQMFRTGRGRN